MQPGRLVIAAVALLAGTIVAQAQQKMTLEMAEKIISAAIAEADRNHWRAVVAIVDEAGWLVALRRMDDPAMLASVELAPGKAKTAALFSKPTAELEKTVNGGRFAAVTAPGAVEMQGGIPLTVDGRVVGAIGVSAATPGQDQQIAEAGVRAFSQH